MATNHQTESTAIQIGEVAKRTSLTFDTIRKAVVGHYPVDCEGAHCSVGAEAA